MGGFVSAGGFHPIVTEEQLRLRPKYLAAIRSIRVEDIEDKSKGDLLSKGVVLLQGLWFTAQCLTRLLQHLPLTELEVETLAFQFVNLAIWFLWLHKPLDVQQPIILGPADELAALAKPSSPNCSLLDVACATFDSLLMGDYNCFHQIHFSSFVLVHARIIHEWIPCQRSWQRRHPLCLQVHFY
jgi:hypothetical protein